MCRRSCSSAGLVHADWRLYSLVLLILEESNLPHREELFSITVITVALSVLLHGLTAAPLAKIYGRLAARMGECEENQPVTELPLREGFDKTESGASDK